MGKDILTTIIEHKRVEVETQKQLQPAGKLTEIIGQRNPQSARHSLRQALAASTTGIIAEFKRRSPSKGWINREAKPEEVIPQYEAAGASALSILTDEAFFAGTLDDLTVARPLTGLPILRKDFVIDSYQLLQARAAGADAVLLIAACLEFTQCMALAEEAHHLGLEVLLELHSPDELGYVACVPDLVGVNNRSLGTFHTDASHALTLTDDLTKVTESLPQRPLLVAESGIHDPETACLLRNHGYRGLLIGERFMRGDRPGQELHAFIQQMSNLPTPSAL